MVKSNNRKNIARLHALLAELASVGPFVRGSVVRLGPTRQPMLSLNKERRTRLVYLGKSRLAQAQDYSQNYKRLMELSEAVTLVVMDLLRAGVPHEQIWPPSAPPAGKRSVRKRL